MSRHPDDPRHRLPPDYADADPGDDPSGWDDGAGWDDARGDWQPYPRRRPTPLWQSARFAGMLGVLLVVLVAVALVLPGFGGPGGSPPPAASPSAVAGAPSASVAPSFVRPTPTPQPTFFSYLVQPGDSLNSIAREFETTARSIAFWNREAYPSLDPLSEGYEPNRIEVGWRLLLLPGATYDEDAAPTPTPGTPAPPTVAPTSGPYTPPPTSGGPATVITAGPRGTNQVALTFDMGGRLDPAVDIMEWLVEHDVKATIFPTGKQGTEQPVGRAALEIVRDHPELFVLGNHSWDHPSFPDLTGAQMRDQLERTEDGLGALVGRTTRPYFRPPFGAWNAAVREAVGSRGWSYVVMWDVDTIDWRPTSDGGPTAQDIETKVLSNAQGGSFVLMHLGGWHTLEALPGIVEGLRERGLEPVTLTELLGG
jgi:peptidoglycan/xylan/chitin deacetylase (PgdA/CDA1 family)